MRGNGVSDRGKKKARVMSGHSFLKLFYSPPLHPLFFPAENRGLINSGRGRGRQIWEEAEKRGQEQPNAKNEDY